MPRDDPQAGETWVGKHSGLDIFIHERDGEIVTLSYATGTYLEERYELHVDTVLMFYRLKEAPE